MTFWTGRRVLVTGGEGFIGSTLVDRLVREGADVRGVRPLQAVRRARAGSPARAATTSRSWPATSATPSGCTTSVEGCDVVFHLAALIGIPYSYVAPESYVQTNVMGTHNVAARLPRARRRAAWCTRRRARPTAPRSRVPIAEDHPLQPQSPYSASKIGGDMMALSFYHAFELPVAVVRPFNTYGPRQSARAVIPTILGQLHTGRHGDQARRDHADARLQLRRRHRAGFLAVAERDDAARRGRQHRLRAARSPSATSSSC